MNSKEKIKYRKTRTWGDIRKSLLLEKSYTCDLCHNKLPSKRLQVHHIKPEFYGDEIDHPEAICLLCNADHDFVERWKKKKIIQGKYCSKYTYAIWNIIKDFISEKPSEEKLQLMRKMSLST